MKRSSSTLLSFSTRDAPDADGDFAQQAEASRRAVPSPPCLYAALAVLDDRQVDLPRPLPERETGSNIVLDPRCLPSTGAILLFLTNHALHRTHYDFDEASNLLTKLVDWEMHHMPCCMDASTKRIRAATFFSLDEGVAPKEIVANACKFRQSHDYVLISDDHRKVEKSLIRALLESGRDDVYLVTETWNAHRSPRALPLLPRSAWSHVNTMNKPCLKYGISSYFCMVPLHEVKLDFGLVQYDETIEAHLAETWRELTLDYKRAISFNLLFGLYVQAEMDHCHDILVAFVEAHPKFKLELPERALARVVPI